MVNYKDFIVRVELDDSVIEFLKNVSDVSVETCTCSSCTNNATPEVLYTIWCNVNKYVSIPHTKNSFFCSYSDYWVRKSSLRGLVSVDHIENKN